MVSVPRIRPLFEIKCGFPKNILLVSGFGFLLNSRYKWVAIACFKGWPEESATWGICKDMQVQNGFKLGDGVALLVERCTPDPKTRGSNPVRSTRVFPSQKCCADSLSVFPKPHMYVYVRRRMITHAR